MADDTTIRQPEDPNFVNTSQEWEMNYWAKKWNVTKQQIRDCVRRVGNRAADVARCLGR